jgi:hypothetical protein
LTWFLNNWSFLVVLACAVGVAIVYINKFVHIPNNEQLAKLKQWLLFAVIEAEKQYQGGTGALKLRAVYNEFCKVFPSLVPIVSFAVFSELVDEALEQMKHLLETNLDIANYIEGE